MPQAGSCPTTVPPVSKSNEELAQYILNEVGGPENVEAFTNCMTRLRISLRNAHLADVPALKQTDGVLGVVSADDGVQVIIGPGKVVKVTEAFGAAMSAAGGGAVRTAVVDEELPPDLADRTRAELKAKQTSWIQRALRHIGNIFIPLIPGFVGCGLIVGITSVMTNLATSGRIDDALLQQGWFRLFAAVGGLLLGSLGVFVGINAAKEFGGTEVLGGLAGLLIYAPVLLPLEADGSGGISPINVFGLSLALRPGLGGLLGVIIAVWVWVQIEKWARSWCPEAIDLMVVPLVTIILGTIFTVFIVMPIAGIIMQALTWFLVDIALDQLGLIGGYLLAASFLPLVTIGLHQGLTPVHIELIQETGETRLLPVLACAGAAQFGAAIAIYLKTRDHGLRKRIGAGAPVGFLGVGEPLIYGVTLPLGRPFVAACLAAGFGGMWMSVNDIGAIAVGLSGEALIPLIANAKYLEYFLGLVICYVAGFIITYTWGFKEEMVEKLYA
jgi:PTS system sucrose-specific IIC component